MPLLRVAARRAVLARPAGVRRVVACRALSSEAAAPSLFERVRDAYRGPKNETSTYRTVLKNKPIGLEVREDPASPERMINAIPPIVVDGNVAVCEGGDAALGHPVEYIQLNVTRAGVPETCKYCGLRYVAKAHH